MLRVILADDEQYERNYLEKVIKERGLPLLLFLCYSKEKDKFYTRL